MQLPFSLWKRLIEHSREAKPREACGLVAGSDGTASEFFAMPNADHSETTYLVAPQAQFEAFRAMRRKGLDLLGIFHSHPATEAYPSKRDVELALYPDSRYLILSLAGADPVLRSFFIKDGVVSEDRVEIIDDEAATITSN